ncbi:MAG: RDD family protein [Salinivirgaceae bacterium]|nr:RDD family protein [Salinivirgaceae bacterium]
MEKRIGFGPRLGAYVIDIVFVWILAGILSRVSTSWMAVLAQQQVDALVSSNPFFAQIYTPEMLNIVVATTRISLIVIFAELIYFSTEIFLGASLGKIILGLKIANADGGNASVGALIGRYLLKHVKRVCTVLAFLVLTRVFNFFGSLFGFVIFIGCFFAAGDRHQALHDMICKTIVVRKITFIV